MARGNLPAQTPTVPPDVFPAMDLLYRFLLQFDDDVRKLEGLSRTTNYSIASSTVLADDTILRFDMKAQRKYRIDCLLAVSANSKMRHTGPAAPSVFLLKRRLVDTAGNSTTLDTAYSAADVALANAGLLWLRGIIHNGANAGTFKIQFAQNASNVTPSLLYAGSVLRYSLVD